MRLFLNKDELYKLSHYEEIVEKSEQKSRDIDWYISANGYLYQLAIGCYKHPSYRAHRKPAIDCGICRGMLIAADYLRDNRFDLLRARKPGKKAKSL